MLSTAPSGARAAQADAPLQTPPPAPEAAQAPDAGTVVQAPAPQVDAGTVAESEAYDVGADEFSEEVVVVGLQRSMRRRRPSSATPTRSSTRWWRRTFGKLAGRNRIRDGGTHSRGSGGPRSRRGGRPGAGARPARPHDDRQRPGISPPRRAASRSPISRRAASRRSRSTNPRRPIRSRRHRRARPTSARAGRSTLTASSSPAPWRGTYAHPVRPCDPNANILITNRWKTGAGEARRAGQFLSYTRLNYLDSARWNTGSIEPGGTAEHRPAVPLPGCCRHLLRRGPAGAAVRQRVRAVAAERRARAYVEGLWQGYRDSVTDRQLEMRLWGNVLDIPI